MSTLFETYSPVFVKHNACIIVPTYNNAGTLKQVLTSVLEYTDRVIVVNDGSTDKTSQIIDGFPLITKVEYPKNKGKGKALRTGFEKAMNLGYDHAITIDSDGQHFASDLPLFLAQLDTEKEAIIIGSRNLQQENMPGKNTFANKFSNFWYYIETGQKAKDTQSGFRSYPIYLMKNMIFFGSKYEFEVEVLVRSAWKGIKVIWIPVTVYYAPPGERISHFRPSIDFSRISVLNTILVLVAFLYIKPRDLILKMSKIKNVKEMLRKNLFNKEEPPIRKAASIGLGVFMGIVPIWGFQMAIALALAAIFKLNKALTLIASNISIPPMIPFIVFFSFLFGRIWMSGRSVSLIFSKDITMEAVKLNIQQYIYGSITLAVVAGLIAFGVTYSALQVSGKIAARKNGKTR